MRVITRDELINRRDKLHEEDMAQLRGEPPYEKLPRWGMSITMWVHGQIGMLDELISFCEEEAKDGPDN